MKFGLRSIIIIHLGVKPIRGGNPPRERRSVGIIIDLLNENDDLSDSWCENKILVEFINRKIGVIKIEYIIR